MLGSVGLPHVFMVMAGLATFVLVSSVLRDLSATTEVWVVEADVPAGVALRAEHVATVDVPSSAPMLDAFMLTERGLPSGTVRNGLVAGEPLMSSDLVATASAALGRTFTLPVEALVLDGLGLRPGDRIDVIGLGGEGTLRYIAADLEVVRLPSQATASAFAGASSRAGWVTVRVDEHQALDLSAALGRGEIDLVRATGASPVVVERAVDDIGQS